MAGTTKEAKAKLVARFQGGEGKDLDSRKMIAEELGLKPTVVTYYYNAWLADQEKAAAQAPAEAAPQPEVKQPAPVINLEAEIAAAAAALVAENPVPVASEPGPVAPIAEPVADPGAQEPEPEPEFPLPVVGEEYEGQIAVIQPDFILVDLLSFYDEKKQQWLRGIIRRQRLRDNRGSTVTDCRHAGFRHGQQISVKILAIEEGKKGGFSIELLPPPVEAPPVAPLKAKCALPPVGDKIPPVVARGADVAAQEGLGAPPVAVVPAAPLPPVNPTPVPVPVEKPATPARPPLLPPETDLCPTCILNRVCPAPHLYLERQMASQADLPDYLPHMKVTYGRRPIVACSEYLPK